MKKSYFPFSLIIICLFLTNFSIKAAFVTYGNFTIQVPDNPTIIYENGNIPLSWSVGGGNTIGVDLEFIIESKDKNKTPAIFGNNNLLFSTNWNGSTTIKPKSEGKFSLIARIKQNGTIKQTTTLKEFEVKYSTIYELQGNSTIYTGLQYRYEISSMANVQSTNWSISNPSITFVLKGINAVNLMPTQAGTAILTYEITLVTGDKRTLTKPLTINLYPFNNIAITGDDKVTYTGKQITYKLTGALPGTTVRWETNQLGAKIEKGQNTNEISLSLFDVSQFKLSAIVTSNGLSKTLTKDISVSYNLPYKILNLNTNKNLKNGEILSYKIEGADTYLKDPNFKLLWSGENIIYISDIVNKNTVQAKAFGSGQCKVIANLIWGTDTVKISNSEITTSYPTVVPELTNLSFSSKKRSFTLTLINKSTNKPLEGEYKWELLDDLGTPINNTFNTWFYYHPGYTPNWNTDNKSSDFDMYIINESPTLKFNIDHAHSAFGFYTKRCLIPIKITVKNNYGERLFFCTIITDNNKSGNLELISFNSTVDKSTTSLRSVEANTIDKYEIISKENSFNENLEYDVKIYSISNGQVVYSTKKVSGFNVINTGLRKGFYILEKIDSDGNRKAAKIYIP